MFDSVRKTLKSGLGMEISFYFEFLHACVLISLSSRVSGATWINPFIFKEIIIMAEEVDQSTSVASSTEYDDQNIFAKIMRGEIPSHKVLETDDCVAILDAFPVKRYHTLLLPKEASVNAGTMSEDAAAKTFSQLPKLVNAVKKVSGAPAVKVISNVGSEAGQVVFHTHIHVVPIFEKHQKFQSSSEMVDSTEGQESVANLQPLLGAPIDGPEEYDDQNIFAKIMRGEIPSHKVLETDDCVAILDAFPVKRYHTLLLPKGPTVNAGDMSEDFASKALSQLPKLINAVKQASGAPAVKVISNAGSQAGQEVFHTHFHIVPMFTADQSFANASKMVDSDEAAESIATLKSLL